MSLLETLVGRCDACKSIFWSMNILENFNFFFAHSCLEMFEKSSARIIFLLSVSLYVFFFQDALCKFCSWWGSGAVEAKAPLVIDLNLIILEEKVLKLESV